LSQQRPFAMYMEPKLDSSSLVVGWAKDAGQVGAGVVDCLIAKLRGECFGEIEPQAFFSLEGVAVEDDTARFPESKFYRCRESNLVMLISEPPESEWYGFLDCVLDVAVRLCNAKEIYTVGGMFSVAAHTAPRETFAIANSPEMNQLLRQYGLPGGLEYQTPPGQRPTINSFLLWVAKKRGVTGASLWTAVPFYLASLEDRRAWRKPLEFLDERFDLAMDFSELDEEIGRQDDKLARARLDCPEIDSYVQRVENKLGLNEEEAETLAARIEEYLKNKD
jgi:predicted ATP-grasp superfamily ATP-dependent carboligase